MVIKLTSGLSSDCSLFSIGNHGLREDGGEQKGGGGDLSGSVRHVDDELVFITMQS